MLCPAAMSSAVQVEASAGAAAAQANASRFSQLIGTPCQDRLSADTYTDGSAGSNDLSKQFPILDILSQIRTLDFPGARSAQGGQSGDSAEASKEQGEDSSELSDFDGGASQVIAAQDEILRTVLMFETLSSTRQGVQTLFQLQG